MGFGYEIKAMHFWLKMSVHRSSHPLGFSREYDIGAFIHRVFDEGNQSVPEGPNAVDRIDA